MILRKQFLAHVAQTSPSPILVEVARAEGSFFYTPEGKRYFDLVAGVSVSNVGHGNPAVVRAVQEQAARYMHVMVYGEMVESPQVTYAARIAAALPAPLDSVYFVNSGAEAVEGALKLAKRVTERTELVSMRRAYHGSTHGAMSMMGTPEGEEWKAAFRPLLPDVRAIEFNDFEALDRITRRTAAVLVEPVQGEAGVRLPAAGWLEALRERCDRTGALLVFDEIQTGLGRTGALFAMQRYGITPDIVREISAKKDEPQWMLDMRLRGFKAFLEKPMPDWGVDLSGFNADDFKYYVKPIDKQAKTWEELPDDIRSTYDRLGIPEAEKSRLISGVAAQYESEVIYNSIQKDLADQLK